MASPPANHSADPTLLTHWRRLVADAPNTPCLIEAATGKVYTRSEIEVLAEHWSAQHAHHPLRERLVAFSLPNGAAWIAAFLGILKCGGIAVPLDASEPEAARRELCQAAGASYLLRDEQLEEIATGRPAGPELAHFCLVKLTSGTTGASRPLFFTHAQMIADGRQICRTMDIRPVDLNLALIPFGHSYGLGNLVVPLLIQGTAAMCVSAPLPHAIAADCERWAPSVFPAVPALLRILSVSDVPSSALQGLRVVISAGSVLSPEIARAFFNKFSRLVHGFYGSSETGGISYDRSGEATLTGRGVGTPLEGVSLEFDREHRFLVQSAAVFTHENPLAAPGAPGRHQPADTGELNAHGELVLLGRTGRMVKISGRRLDLSELENNLRRLPGIQDAFTMPHPGNPDDLAAALATQLSLEEARALLRAHLAPWKVPRRLWVTSEFPLTERGKSNTRALREILANLR